jgi:hypothetical protein
MAIPQVVLGVFSIFFGYVTKDLFVGMATDFYNDALFVKCFCIRFPTTTIARD